MTEQNAFRPNYAVAPGEVLDEHREAAGLTQLELSQRLGFSVKHVNRLIAGLEPVTPETALKLESIFGLAAGAWLNLEARYREFQARKADIESLAAEEAWLADIPHRSMAKLEWIPSDYRGPELVRCLRSFFGVGSLNYLPNIWAGVQAAYRDTKAFKSHEWALLAWLAQGAREAEGIQTKPFDAASLRSSLQDIKRLSRLPGAEFHAPLVERCAAHGVVLVFVPAPEGARVFGATRWLDKDRALIQLSLRYRTNDQLWFTLFHEFGHVLLHGKREQFLDFDKERQETAQEQEANEFASRQLVSAHELSAFVEKNEFTFRTVEAFAEQEGVAPGIVVGQLQHREILPFNSVLSRLKISFRFT